jgi:hypothetical protein
VAGLRVLQLPVNVASHMSTTIAGLQAAGIEARGLVLWGRSPVRDDSGVVRLSGADSRGSPRWLAEISLRLPSFVGEIRRADVLHWYMTAALPGGADVRLADRLGRAGIVEFAGGDIRYPELESQDNPYWAEIQPLYEYRSWENKERSQRTQALFGRHGCEALVSCPSLLRYVDRERFAQVHLVRQRIPVSSFVPAYPDPEVARPLVVHASTARHTKGTPWVLETVERLRKRVEFDFELLEGIPHREALATVGRADVYLDQFVVGAHGSAAIEAMALGKPVVGYIKPSVMAAYPPEMPLVNASRETLDDVLERLLGDGSRRHELGVRSRAYAERHHDAVRLAAELGEVYEGALRRRAG